MDQALSKIDEYEDDSCIMTMADVKKQETKTGFSLDVKGLERDGAVEGVQESTVTVSIHVSRPTAVAHAMLQVTFDLPDGSQASEEVCNADPEASIVEAQLLLWLSLSSATLSRCLRPMSRQSSLS
jgi:hypothetical protein